MSHEIYSSLTVALLLVNAALLAYVCFAVKRGGTESGPLERALREEFRTGREEAAGAARELREEVSGTQRAVAERLESRLEQLRESVHQQLDRLQKGNEQKLDQMRKTVDEQLQGTLEKRLGESFKLVGERLEQVHQGLGEMRQLATGVGDLKRVLTNVKARGTWVVSQFET